MINERNICSGCGRELNKCLVCKQEFKVGDNKKSNDRRHIISWRFIIAFIFLLITPYLIKYNLVFYESILGRIYFCFCFYLLGLSFRAFSYHMATKRGVIFYVDNFPWKSYLFEYVPMGMVVSVFIFSVVTASFESIYLTPIFYLLTGSIGVVAGYVGYGFLDKIKAG